jgi:hypothetical protein
MNNPAEESDDELARTESFSDSDDRDGLSDPPEVQQLARALLAWDPVVVTAYSRLRHIDGQPAAFAAFLVRLNTEVSQPSLRGEIIGWLRTLAHDDDKRTKAFQIAVADKGARTAFDLYEVMRRAAQ